MKIDVKAGFTLAEVLITLGIIGVVAAMTIPTLVQNYQKRVAATRLKYAYSVLSQAVRLSEGENGPEESWELDPSENNATENFVKTYLNPYLIGIKEYRLKSPYYYYYRDNNNLTKTVGHTHYSIVLNNGVYLHFNANYGISKKITVRLDINGESGPNILGRDIFGLSFYPKCQISVGATDRKKLLSFCKSNSISDQLYGCTALIKYDGWKISDDYPWK